MFHLEIHPRGSDVKCDPFSSVERNLEGVNKGWSGSRTGEWIREAVHYLRLEKICYFTLLHAAILTSSMLNHFFFPLSLGFYLNGSAFIACFEDGWVGLLSGRCLFTSAMCVSFHSHYKFLSWQKEIQIFTRESGGHYQCSVRIKGTMTQNQTQILIWPKSCIFCNIPLMYLLFS